MTSSTKRTGNTLDVVRVVLDLAETMDHHGDPTRAEFYQRQGQALATLALAEEQRKANIVAAYAGDLIRNPYAVGTRENNEWWAAVTGPLTEELGLA